MRLELEIYCFSQIGKMKINGIWDIYSEVRVQFVLSYRMKGKDKFNSTFEEYKVILVLKEYFEVVETHFEWHIFSGY